MNTLFTLKDTFHRDLPYTSSSSHVNFYVQPDGSRIEVPTHASYVSISALGESGAWAKFGGASDEAIDIPTTTINDGTSPIWINPDDRRVSWLGENDFLYLKSSDSVVVEFWE